MSINRCFKKNIIIDIRHKTIIIFFSITVISSLATGCSILDRVVYHPNINQGNYLNPSDVSKIHIGMNQQQVIYLLGAPIMTDPFGTNTWFYVFRQESNHKKVTQQTLTLIFNSQGILSSMDNNLTID